MRRLRKRSSTGGGLLMVSTRHGLERVQCNRPAAEALRGVRHDRPHVLAESGAEQQQPALLAFPQDRAGGAPDRARAEAPHRRALVAEIDGGEAGEDLAGERAADRDGGEGGGQVDDGGESLVIGSGLLEAVAQGGQGGRLTEGERTCGGVGAPPCPWGRRRAAQ